MNQSRRVSIVGAGPAGLFCAYLLLEKGYAVDLFDQSSGAAKKFLIAGNGGLNLTHSENSDEFVKKYGENEIFFNELLQEFSPQNLREWCESIGVETFIGSSGRVFPKEMSAGKVLLNWLEKLKSYSGFQLFLKHKLVNVKEDNSLTFSTESGEVCQRTQIVIFAMGGASWKKTGSDGKWRPILEEVGVETSNFLPMNCGFEKPWSNYFKENNDRAFLKHVEVSFAGEKAKGDLMLTSYGLEGGVIYALSRSLRDCTLREGSAKIFVDLRPALTIKEIIKKLGVKSKKITLSNHLRKTLKIDRPTFILLKEILSDEILNEPNLLANSLKNLEIELFLPRSIDEAISTSGGVSFEQLTPMLEHKEFKRAYFCGEMLDYDAPTGGYLLQGCFSTAWRVVKGITSTD